MLPLKHLNRVYCAGPLFNERERHEMVAIAQELARGGFEPWVPHRDGMEFSQVQPYLVEQGYDSAAIGRLLHECIFALDVYQVVLGCGSLVCNINGRVPDEGAVSEAALAYMLGKPVIMFKDDARSMITGRDNPLVVGLAGFQTVSRRDKLADALQARIDSLEIDADWETACPPHVESVVRRGEQLWLELQAMGDERPSAAVAETVLELFEFGSCRPDL